MELKYLQTFRTILEAGSFQKAARQLNYAQSTITLQMQLLEQELSVKLFDKIGRKMVLTQAGKELLPYMDAALEAVAQMENYGKKNYELTGTLNIALPETLLNYQMQPVIEQFRQQAPNVRLSLQLSNCYLIREQVLGGGVDMGVHYDVGGYGSSVVTERLSSYPLVLAASTKLDEDELNFTDSHQRKSSSLLTVDRNSLYHKRFAGYLSDRDIVMNGEMEIGSLEAIKRCIQSNLGVACLPRFAVAGELEQGILQEIKMSMENAEITAVCTYHKNKWVTPAMDLFIQLLRTAWQNYSSST
ncbi:MAG: LysR family transcriptional regulator [Lachnospiraceae bacterium]|nr:LysR family transcriptional regulator [Lachnospiraceae bacterium]